MAGEIKKAVIAEIAQKLNCSMQEAAAHYARRNPAYKRQACNLKAKELAAAANAAAGHDDDESFAERSIEAELDRAMGVKNPDYDWLVGPSK